MWAADRRDGEHGTLPFPAPATATATTGKPIYSSDATELTTPTGAALMTTALPVLAVAPVRMLAQVLARATRISHASETLRVLVGVKTRTRGSDFCDDFERN